MTRTASGWQLLLADIALILFLFALASLSRAPRDGEHSTDTNSIAVAPAQALYRSARDGPTLSEWLASQSRDPRATLTVFARHSSGDESAIWARAQRMANAARNDGYPVRVVISAGPDSDIYASLAYDTPPLQPPNAR